MRKIARPTLLAPAAIGFAYWLALVALTVLTLGGHPSFDQGKLLALEAIGLPVAFGVGATLKRRYAALAESFAYRDELTGLPNRTYFMDRLEDALARSARNDSPVAVLFLDLDRFKLVNDTLGHAAGDRLLVEAGKLLKRQVRAGETIARLGGDEFTFILEGLRDHHGAELMAQRVLSAFSTPLLIQGHEIQISASVGIAVNSGGPCQPDELLRKADVALYQAKSDGRACVRVYAPEKGSASIERLEMDAGLRAAIQQDELLLYFQPEVNLTTGRIEGFEALVRWQHPSRGLLLPLAFIPTAEETGLIRSIGRWVLTRACQEAVDWQARFPDHPRLRVSVNVSPLEFRDRGLVGEVARTLEQTGLDPALLKLEIVETALMNDADATLAILHGFRDLGVKLAIDDFGTGYSSLSYLQKFPVDTLKIDRSFIRNAKPQSREHNIIKSIVALAHALGIDVTAEGVETSEQLSILVSSGCDRAQGYLFARPLPAEALVSFLAAQEPIIAAAAA